MKKIQTGVHIIIIISLFMTTFLVPQPVLGQTLGELKKELAEQEEKYKNAEKKEQDTQNKIELNNQTIQDIEKKVSQMEKDVETLSKEIVELNAEIKEKEIELKKVINFAQKTSGESSYLEYAFGAKNFTDFIYRVAVAEQLAKYNEQLLKECEKMIAENRKKQTELETTKKELTEQKKKLNEEVVKLGSQLNDISFIKMDALEEIEMQREAIKTFENMGCKDNENTETCGNRLPTDTSFLRPIISGYVTSEYGYRCYDGSCGLHEAMDMSNSNRTVPIYAAANGIVIGMRIRSSCGGNMIFLLHTINGKKYTTEYAHLRTIDVQIGQVVTKNTQIATMGGDQRTETWDNCSKQQHLHFGIATGHYLKDYGSWNEFLANTFDPRTIINFPWTGGATDPFSDRYTKY